MLHHVALCGILYGRVLRTFRLRIAEASKREQVQGIKRIEVGFPGNPVVQPGSLFLKSKTIEGTEPVVKSSNVKGLGHGICRGDVMSLCAVAYTVDSRLNLYAFVRNTMWSHLKSEHESTFLEWLSSRMNENVLLLKRQTAYHPFCGSWFDSPKSIQEPRLELHIMTLTTVSRQNKHADGKKSFQLSSQVGMDHWKVWSGMI